MGAAASSSSSSLHPPKNYDVFISFRGEDTRTNFTSHLHSALCQKGIKTYIDYELPKGDDISESLMQAIEDSTISVVVLSQNYGSSKWCLDELVKIMECKRDQQQIVIPIFYEVDPSHVRNQGGTYKKAFLKHETDFIHNQEKVNNWRRALSEIANLAGWDSRIYRDESEFIRNIVNNILQKLKLGHPSALKGLVGVDENCDSIELLLEKAPIIGIWGMGGIGKTTMARVVFAKLSSKFDSCCFLENVREESERHGLSYIRDKLLLELLNEENLSNMEFAMRRLSSKKVFIVLDDVNSSKQIEYFARDYNCLGHGSRTIITTRNKHLLTMIGVHKIYEAKELSYNKSLQLFNLKAFRKDYCDIGYEELAERAVLYTKGNPLALITLGSFLHSKTTEEWNSALTRLEKTPNEDIQNVLKLSYDGLNYEEREMFLSIACFLKGEGKEHVEALFDSYGFCASIGLRTLVDKALITINTVYKRVWMHDLLQKMGWEIVRQECIKEPGRRSRLWDPEEVYDVLKNNRGTSAIEGIILDLSEMRDIHLSADTFKQMTNLRFLKICSPWDKKVCTIHLPSSLESFSDTLRYLQWDKFPMESLPPTFCAEKLVELRMPGSRIKKLWDGVQNCVNLRGIDLCGSKQLMELPDFSKTLNLEWMDLSSCISLCHLHPSILSLQRLVFLSLSNCSKLENLRSENHLKYLRNLYVEFCFSLKEFAVSSEEMEVLHLEFTGIEILGSSIGRLSKLTSFYLNGPKLKFLPINELCHLRSLNKLHLSNMGEIIDKSKLSILFAALQSLREIYLVACSNLIELPDNIKHLSRLELLSLQNCKRLQSLPVLPPSIEVVRAKNCTSLETLFTSVVDDRQMQELTWQGYLCELPDKISTLSSLQILELEGSNVQSLPAGIKLLSKLRKINLINCRRLQSLPQLPPFIEYVKVSNCISLETAFHLTTWGPRQKKYLVNSLFLENCMKLEQHSLSRIMENAYFLLKRCVYVHEGGVVCYPGSRFPKWFSYNHTTKASNSITFELSSAVNNLVGFVLCCIVPRFTSKKNSEIYLRCQCRFEDGEKIEETRCAMSTAELISDHVFQWYGFVFSSKILWALLRREEIQGITYNPKLSFEFSVIINHNNGKKIMTTHDDLIKGCGVCPIYASDYHNFLQQMELELELAMKTNRGRPIDKHSLCGLMEYTTFSLNNCERSIISYPETKIPEWFTIKSSTTEDSIIVKVASDLDYLLGFAFCFVIPQFSSEEMHRSHSTSLCYYGKDFCMEGPSGWHYSMTDLNLDKVFLWYDPLYCEYILEQLGRKRGKNMEGSSNIPELTFEFKFGDCLIKECGVRPIYASEYNDFLQQMNLKLKLRTKTRRYRDTDDEEQLTPSKKLKDSSIVEPVLEELATKSMAFQNIDELLIALPKLKLEALDSALPK